MGEFRGPPSNSIGEVISGFLAVYYEVLQQAKEYNLTVDTSGHTEISPEMYAKALRLANIKEVAKCANIYGTDILTLSDQVVKKGKVTGMNVSCGLHIHFSSEVQDTRKLSEAVYTPVVLPLSVQDVPVNISLYRKSGGEDTKLLKVVASRITTPVITHFVTRLDEELLKKYEITTRLKYRQPGWYEKKCWGFEYRSLPFNSNTIEDVFDIVNFAFSLFDDL